jgi:outer membrane protein assembly factor BamD (BamD/ComL family)
VLADAADTLYTLRDADQAVEVARKLLALQPPAGGAQRRVAWTVIAHTAFERGEFDAAERGYTEVLALVPPRDGAREPLVERLAASVYKQGEQARTQGDARGAVAQFERVAALAPQSAVRATAQYDAAAALIGLKDWDAAVATLEDFRRRHPNHALADEVTAKLAVAYVEQGQRAKAAAEFERLSVASKDPALAREALWQSAELYEKAGSRPAAVRAYERHLRQHPQPLERAIEARWRLARLARADGQTAREAAWQKEIFQADQSGGEARTPRTRHLGANAALALAEPAFEAYRKVALVEPLARQLKLKKARLEEALKAYAVASDYGVPEVGTAATFQVAALYQDFGRALMASQRPAKLSKAEREQYDVLLEEQAYPFEEKAIALHEANTRRASAGLYDTWVQKSFTALRELRPVRYGKNERSEGGIDAIR